MGQYSAGTVTVTGAPSATITGTGTLWATFVSAGDEILVGSDSTFYVVASVTSNTELQLTAPYPSNVADATYVVNRGFTTHYGIPKPSHGDIGLPETISRAMEVIDQAIEDIPAPATPNLSAVITAGNNSGANPVNNATTAANALNLGGVAAASYLTAVPDPIVPADGTQNITGGLALTGTLTIPNGGIIRPSSDGVAALEFRDYANTFHMISLNTTNNRVGINTAAPASTLDIKGSLRFKASDTDGFAVSQLDTLKWGWSGLSGAMKFVLQNSHFFVDGTGRIGVGIATTAAPSARVHIVAGTATAGTAPIKLTAGTNLGTPEAGAIEFDGTNLYVTQSDGTRKTIAFV